MQVRMCLCWLFSQFWGVHCVLDLPFPGKWVLRCFFVRIRMISDAACLRWSSALVSGKGMVSGRKITVSASRTALVAGMKHFTHRSDVEMGRCTRRRFHVGPTTYGLLAYHVRQLWYLEVPLELHCSCSCHTSMRRMKVSDWLGNCEGDWEWFLLVEVDNPILQPEKLNCKHLNRLGSGF